MAAPNILCDTAGMTNAQWLAARMHGPSGKIPYTVGGSDVAAVFGVSPWTTPLELWMIKKGRMKPPTKSNANQLEMGHLLEPIAAHWYAKKTGNRVYEDTNLYQHADHPYALANFDRRFERASDGEPGILECKSCTYHKASEWDDGAIPLYYELQLRFYLAVADVNIGSFSAIWGNNPDNDLAIPDITRDKAKEDMIFERLDEWIWSLEHDKPPTMSGVTDIDARHATYRALLSKLTLASDHKENLLGRGLTDADIERLGYKTTPVVGMTQIAKQLQSEGLYLAGVPGFYRDDNGAWTFIHEKRGILIPVRDRYGRIQGLQIRRDNVEKRKFRWVSSTEKKDGCKAEGWTHLSGPVRPMLVLTEGPMKADVINALTGLTVLAVPGVNSLTQLELTLTELRSEGLVEIKTAFDMDFATNHHVQNGYNNLLQLLGDMGFRYGTYLWNPAYKGLDDYIWEYLFRKKQS